MLAGQTQIALRVGCSSVILMTGGLSKLFPLEAVNLMALQGSSI